MDWISIIVGAGGLVGIVTAFLTYRTNQRERQIQWYDRAIDEIERLEGKLKECQNSKYDIKEKYLELRYGTRKEDDDE